MAKDIKGFLKIKRQGSAYRPTCERVKDYSEVFKIRAEGHSKEQATRCMDCGTPFCNWGCPLGNYIPEWNELSSVGLWERAAGLLEATNNMPEVTGRICPAPCEYACVLGINDDPVTVRENELAVVERGFRDGLIKARPPLKRTGKKVAVIGSGPAGLSAAAELNRLGHKVTVFEKDVRIGGILRYGIPDFKLDKEILDRRLKIWKEEGIEFRSSVNAGVDYPVGKLRKDFDAVCLAIGSRTPRDLKIEGRDLAGVHFAMDYLIQSNKRICGEKFSKDKLIDAKGKRVLVIGGGDTGADCVGTAHRQGALCVVQVEVLPVPPKERPLNMPWPRYPLLFKTSTSHEEGGERHWQVLTKRFVGKTGKVKKVICAKLDRNQKEIAGSEFEIEADLVILAIGFLHPEHDGLVSGLGLALDDRGNVKADNRYMASAKGVFCCGDARRGQSLVVWAISEGRNAASSINSYLMG